MNKKTWWKLDHHVWHELKKYSLEKKSVIVAMSGGADSLALAHSLTKVLGPNKVSIAYYHHGGTLKYRQEAHEFCQDFAKKNDLQFVSEKWQSEKRQGEKFKKELKSEAQMREARYAFLLNLQKQNPNFLVATGHQQNDVMETRLIRLIRGTGPQGLGAIQVYRPPFIRPLLAISRTAIQLYLNKEGLIPRQDPSNQDDHYLRNWLRRQWLPQLEIKRPGSQASLGRSLEALVQSFHKISQETSQEPRDLILRSEFLAQTETEQTRWLARALLHSGRKDFTQFHLQEIRRRLIQSPKNNSFKVAGCEWRINAQQIKVQLSIQAL